MTVFVLAFVLTASPWIIRNYRWSGLFVPASTHGGIQLWFGSLQTGAYQSNWFYHPQAAVEFAAVDYNSLDAFPIIVTGQAAGCGPAADTRVEFVYWTNREPAVQRVPVPLDAAGRFSVALPVMAAPTAISYYLEASAGQAAKSLAPAAADRDDTFFFFFFFVVASFRYVLLACASCPFAWFSRATNGRSSISKSTCPFRTYEPS